MASENEISVVDSVGDNGLATSSHSDHSNDNIRTNGSCSGEISNAGANLIEKGRDKEGAGTEKGRNSEYSQPSRSQSPSLGSNPVPKGYGLRKWRRIKRDVVKDVSPNEDNSKALKRGLSMSGNPNKGANMLSADRKQINMAVVDGLLIHGTGNESRFAVGPTFGPGTDSENSEDQSSRSSTAASAPRLKFDVPARLGYSRIKNLSGKSASSSSTQRVQQGKGQVESTKKHRGERIKIEKENSHSSIESDSRSSNFVFAQGVRSVTCNGNQNQRSTYYDGQNSNGVHGHYDQENGEAGDGSQDELTADASWEGTGEKIQNHRRSPDVDPLVESIASLQSVQEALESEVQKFRKLEWSSSSPFDSTFLDQEIQESSSSDQYDAEMTGQSSISESQVSSLTENVKLLESRLEKAEATIKEKESRITELENTLISRKSTAEESENIAELEQIFRQKIEGEIEYLTLSNTMQKMTVAAGDQMALFEQKETVAGEQMQMLNTRGKAEKKAEILKEKAGKVEKIQDEILWTEVLLKTRSKVYKVTWYFLIQLVLLLLVLCLVLQLSSHRGFVVPT